MKKILVILIIMLTLIPINKIVYADNSSSDNIECIEVHNSINSSGSGSSSGGNGSLNETWYDIGQSLPHAVDYSESDLLKILKPGDIIYEAEGGGGFTGHAALVEGTFYDAAYTQQYIRILESVSCGVSRGLMTPTRFTEKKVSIFRLADADSSQINGAIDFFISQLGKTYLLSPVKKTSSNSLGWYCSELVWASYYSQGINLFDSNDPIVLPIDLTKYENATLIMDYRYPTIISSRANTGHVLSCNNEEFLENHELQVSNECVDICKVCLYQSAHHNYRYMWRNYTQHRTYCSCQGNRFEPHVIASGSLVPGSSYGTCILCGGEAEIGFSGPNYIISDKLLCYNKGSYILPNGVMVLEDDEIDLFLEGKFTVKNKIDNSVNDVPFIYLKKEEHSIYDC